MTIIKLEKNQRHPSSFRDPAGTIYDVDGKIIRALSETGARRYHEARHYGLLDRFEQAKKIIQTTEITFENNDKSYTKYLEHARIPFISYPYEWPFLLLKDAALLHLSLQLEALDSDFVLTDASAYNIQFQGVTPIFIDILSFRKYQPGELWISHRQFCEQFLNPLLLFSMKGIPHHAWYRGAFEGIPMEAIARLLPLRSWFSLRALTHIFLPVNYTHSRKNELKQLEKIRKAVIPKSVYHSFLTQLYEWISELKPKKSVVSLWESYDVSQPYEASEHQAKKEFIADFATQNKNAFLLDLGCNTGEFSEVALANGVSNVIGFDLDIGALNKAVLRAKQKKLNFLPLYQELSNPSPAQGWMLTERLTTASRGTPDAMIALAFLHHLVIGHHIIFSEAVAWLVSLAPVGVIEFIPKTDPSVSRMLALREDVFSDYSEEVFVTLLQKNTEIIKTEVISASGRCLYWYKNQCG
jgi:ribosomal protein L11 methylase PrmA